MSDYYSLLGITRDAQTDQIKKAYRDKALQYHPDRNPGNPAAEDMFKKINEAYSVLGDERKRFDYDNGTGAFNRTAWSTPGRDAGTGGYGQYTWTWQGPFPGEESYRERAPLRKKDAYDLLFRSVGTVVLGVLLFRFSLVFGIFGLILCVTAIGRGLVNTLQAVRLLFSLKE